MAPVSQPSTARTRPQDVLLPSVEGYLAYIRIAKSRRRGLGWVRPNDDDGPSPRAPSTAESTTFNAQLRNLSFLIPAIASWMWEKGAVKQARQGGHGEASLRQILIGLGKHSWDLGSYLDGVPERQILEIIASSGSTPPCLSAPGSGTRGPSEIDLYVLKLAKWFKSDYMSWIDPIRCPRCTGSTSSIGATAPTPAEQAEGGGRVELHKCSDPACGQVRRFVRYGKIGPLLRTREGRCGEWAHLFYAFSRVSGVDARYVWNSEDHVWAEYWSPVKQHWVHVDPCEAAVDKPLLYDKGWGKKQAYCIAVGPRGAEDVTAVYVSDHEACLQRRRSRGWRERILALALDQYTLFLQLRYTPAEREASREMARKQAVYKADLKGRLDEAEREELGGRISGPEEWKKMRDEVGSVAVARPKYTVKRELHNLKSSDIYMFGDAARSGGGVILTTGSSQTSAVFADTTVSPTKSFRFTLTFRMTAPPGAGEADGMALVFSRDRKLGLGGYGLGYTALGGEGDFAVEIDTYRTQDHADDPPTPHVSVHSPPHAHHRHSIACTEAGRVPFLSDGRVWRLEVLFNGAARRLKGWLSSRGESQDEQDIVEIPLWDVAVPRCGDSLGDWYVGVTGSCGGLWQKQEVLDWIIEEIKMDEAPISNFPDTEQI